MWCISLCSALVPMQSHRILILFEMLLVSMVLADLCSIFSCIDECESLLVSSRFGFGLMDAGLMTWYASGWKNVPPMSTCESLISNPKRPIPPRSHEIFNLNLNECKNDADPKREVNYIEQVQVYVTLATDRRGEIEIYLHSPSNTRTQLLPVNSLSVTDHWIFIFDWFSDANVIKVIKDLPIGLFSPFNYGEKCLTGHGNCKLSTTGEDQVRKRIDPQRFAEWDAFARIQCFWLTGFFF